MLEVILLEIISVVSFSFAILTSILSFTSLSNFFYIFIWTVLVSLVFSIVYEKNKISRIFILLISGPLIFFKASSSLYFFLIILVILYFYLTRSLLKGSYRDYSYSFKKSIGFIFILLLIFSIPGDLNKSLYYILPFIIIYLLSTLILIRTLRHLDSNMDINLVKKINRKYLIIITITSFLVSIDKLRGFVFLNVKNIYNFIVDIFIKILYLILYYPLNILFYYIVKFFNFLLSKFGSYEEIPLGMFGPGINEFTSEEYLPRDVPFLDNILQIIFLISICYIIYRIIKKSGERKIKNLDYTVEREFIKGFRDKQIKNRIFKPKNLQEQIRYYYRKYLFRLKSNDIIIKDSNTSLEINENAKYKYNEGTIDELRDAYVSVRYGDKEVTKEDIKTIEKLYKEIKSQD